MDAFADFDEIGEYCIAAASVTWEKPRRGGYYYGRVWNRRDPQKVVKCLHRHRSPEGAMKCMRLYLRTGEVSGEFGVDSP